MRYPGLHLDYDVSEDGDYNSLVDMFNRTAGRKIGGSVNITANNETKIFNVFKFTGTVRILDQWAIITDATALTNCTNVYATVYDGTNTANLTADGMTLSGATVGTFFTKDMVIAQPYSMLDADQVRVLETLEDRKVGRPFTVNGKNGVDNYIRFQVTTNTTLDFTMYVGFEYELYNGSTLEFA